MYQCFIPPRLFLAVGVGFLIFSLVLGWISFSVPDWLQFYENSGLKGPFIRNSTTENNPRDDENLADLKKFGLWYKCVFSTILNDFNCTLWNNDAPSFIRVAQVLIPFGLSLGCLSLLSAITGFMCRRIFVTTVLFSALFAFLNFIFTTIGVTVFATESVVYVERLRLSNNEHSRHWGMWLILPNVVLSFLASVCFILASIFNWCDYRSMHVTGILNHSIDKYGGSVFKAPSDSNLTAPIKKQSQYLHQQQTPGQDYTNTCYQINGANNNPNTMNYPLPPNYGASMHHHGSTGALNQAFPTAPGLLGYSRPPSPTMNGFHPHANLDPYHSRYYTTENSEQEDVPRASRSHRRSHSRRHSSHRSRSHSSRESISGNNSQESNPVQPQFIPIPVPYYQPPAQSQPPPIQPTTQVLNPSSNLNNNNNNQPLSYVIQPPKQQFIEEFIQPAMKPMSMLTYGSGQPSMIVSNPTQPVYTIAYRANNGGSMLASNIIAGPAATTYVTAARNPIAERNSSNGDSDHDEKHCRAEAKSRQSKNINANEAWTWRKL